MNPRQSEFTVLRQTIAIRGTVRMALVPVTAIGWGVATIALLHPGPGGHGALHWLIPLGILIGGFEAVHALHVGVERIGRYLQVYYEGSADAPAWETTIVAVGPALPGGGIDPLFSVVFLALTAVNLALGFTSLQTTTDYIAVLPVYAMFAARVIRARAAAARQRAVDLETFRALRSAGQPS